MDLAVSEKWARIPFGGAEFLSSLVQRALRAFGATFCVCSDFSIFFMALREAQGAKTASKAHPNRQKSRFWCIWGQISTGKDFNAIFRSSRSSWKLKSSKKDFQRGFKRQKSISDNFSLSKECLKAKQVKFHWKKAAQSILKHMVLREGFCGLCRECEEGKMSFKVEFRPQKTRFVPLACVSKQ